MDDTIHALLAEMADELDNNRKCLLGDSGIVHPLAARARAVLAAEPPAPSPDPSDFQAFQGLALDMVESLRPIVIPEILGVLRKAIKMTGQPAPAVDGEREELADRIGWIAAQLSDIGWGNDSASVARAAALLRQPAPAPDPAADGARLRQCSTHGLQPANAWGCPECVRELREELARLKAPAADGEREELAQWLEGLGDHYDDLYRPTSDLVVPKLTRAAALLRQPAPAPEGLFPVEYWHMDSGARIISEPSEEQSGGCWVVRNSRHVNPCTEFPTVAAALAALQPRQGEEVAE